MQTNEAGIKIRKDGRYVVRATAKCPWTGEMLEAQKTMKSGATLAAAVAKRDELKLKLKNQNQPSGYVVSEPTEQTTLSAFCAWWMEQKAATRKVSTCAKYAQVLGHHVIPHLGHLPISRLTRHDVMQWTKLMETKIKPGGARYADQYVKGCWRVLRTLLKDAHGWGFLSEDITARQAPPSTPVKNRQEKKTLSRSELIEFLSAFGEIYPQRYAEVLTLASTGMRPGELYGLEWSDIDLDHRTILVRRSVYRGTVDTTKTDAPRHVAMSQALADALLQHRREQVASQAPGMETGVVFPSNTGTHRHPSSIRKPMALVAKHIKLGQRVTPQVLRRTHITMLVAAGIDLITIWSMVGHSSVAMTRRYSGVRMESKHAALDTLHSLGDEALEGVSAELVEQAMGLA